MNERAREALVTAALSGRKQIKGALTDGIDGRCALGILAEEVFGECRHAKDQNELIKAFRELGLSAREELDIQRANDHLGWDFLTIARKIGNDDAVNPTQEVTK